MQYGYDAFDSLVSAVSGSYEVEKYFRDDVGNIFNEELVSWIFDEGTFKPAAKLVCGERYSIINDHLGTPKEAYDSDGNKVWECELTAYGKVKECTDASFIPFRFQGQYEDVETGLYYNRFRYYDCSCGAYISQDPI